MLSPLSRPRLVLRLTPTLHLAVAALQARQQTERRRWGRLEVELVGDGRRRPHFMPRVCVCICLKGGVKKGAGEVSLVRFKELKYLIQLLGN